MIGVKKKEDIFYSLFMDSAKKIVVAGETFSELVHNYEDVRDKVANIKVLETECDMQVHKILKSLNGSFITPFDREDIYEIAKLMDDIVDSIEEVSHQFIIFDIQYMKPEAVTMTELLLSCINELETLFKHLPDFKKDSIIMDQIIEVNRLENEGDVIFRKALSALFKEEKDPIELIKWKHIYELLEESLDACENVANIIEGVTMKYA